MSFNFGGFLAIDEFYRSDAFLMSNQQCQSTEGRTALEDIILLLFMFICLLLLLLSDIRHSCANCCYRKAGVNLPTKKLVPARVVPSAAAVTDTTSVPDDKKVTPSPATSADSVASAAVAAVIASQTYVKVSASVFL